MPVKVFMMDLWATVPYYCAYLCRALRANDILVTLGSITYYLDPGCFSERGLRNRPGLLDVVGRFRLPRSLRRLLKLLESVLNMLATSLRMLYDRPDVVHVQLLPLLKWRVPLEIWFLRYCRRLGIKLVYTVHDLLPHDTGEHHQQCFYQLYGMMDALICHSESAKRKLVADFGVAQERVWVIPHGPFFYDCPAPCATDIHAKYGVAPGDGLVLLQGIIFPYKGVNFLLEAWAKLQQAGTKARLVVAGTGSPEIVAALEGRAEALGISASISFDFRFLPIGELTSLYQAADVVVYPYKAITTSGALLTGIALGKAIVATKLPAFAELLQHDQNALLVDYDDAEALAAAIIRLVNEPATRLRLAEHLKELSSGDETWAEIALETKRCYSSVLRDEARRVGGICHEQAH